MPQKHQIEFEKIQDQLQAMHDEIDKLSKKKPDDAINKFKLNFINEILAKANTILDREYLPFDQFSKFDEDQLPTNSDVVMVLAQYLAAFKREYTDKKMWLGNVF